MKRIPLRKKEKELLQKVSCNGPLSLSSEEQSNENFIQIIESLCMKGFFNLNVFDYKITTVELSDYGKRYLKENPKLRNPIPWNLISMIASFTALGLSIFRLLTM